MDIEQNLNDMANRYRSQGYQVVIHPTTDDLPDFAKAFQVEMVAKRADGSALVCAKNSNREFEADTSIADYADAAARQPGWRLDVVVLNSSEEAEAAMPDKRDAKEPSEAEFHAQFEIARQLLISKLNQQALVAAWSVLEAAMRLRLQGEGEDVGWGSSPRLLMNELLSAGILSRESFVELERLFSARSAIVHGFSMPTIETRAVEFVLEIARQLLEESKFVNQPS